MTSHPPGIKPFNPQQIIPRRIAFPFDAQIPRLWLRNSSIMTQWLNGTNLALPAFEAYMVRTLQGQLRYLDDPVLRSQVKRLIGQEYHHSQTHQQYNLILRH